MNFLAKYRMQLGIVFLGVCLLLSWPFLTGNHQNSSLTSNANHAGSAKASLAAGERLKEEQREVDNSLDRLPAANPARVSDILKTDATGASNDSAKDRSFRSAITSAGSDNSAANAALTAKETDDSSQQAALARTERLAGLLGLDDKKKAQFVAISAGYQEDRQRIRGESADDASKSKEMTELTESYRRDMRRVLEDSDATRMILLYRQRIAKAQAAADASRPKQ